MDLGKKHPTTLYNTTSFYIQIRMSNVHASEMSE